MMIYVFEPDAALAHVEFCRRTVMARIIIFGYEPFGQGRIRVQPHVVESDVILFHRHADKGQRRGGVAVVARRIARFGDMVRQKGTVAIILGHYHHAFFKAQW